MAEQLFGVYRGNVVNNKDPLNQRRVRLRVPQVLGDAVTDWAWPVDSNSSHFTAPAVGQGVLVMFEGGDPSWPIWIGTFGKEASKDYQLFLKKLKSTENLTPISNLITTVRTPSGETQLDVTETMLKMARKIMERNYLSSYDTTTQTATAINTPKAVTINTVDFASNVSIVAGSKITIANVGAYNLQWSGQFANSSSSTYDVRVWLRYNGVDYPQSASIVAVPGRHGSVNGHVIAAWNWLGKSQNTGDYVEIMWSTEATEVSLTAYPAGGGSPAVPSVIVTLTECE